jgi:hypothetical protein
MKPHIGRVEFVHGFLSRIFAGNLRAKRIESLANGALGVMTSASLAVSIIGHSLAQARGLIDKHAIKQVDRLSSHRGVVVWEIIGALGEGSRRPTQGDRRPHGLDRFRR